MTVAVIAAKIAKERKNTKMIEKTLERLTNQQYRERPAISRSNLFKIAKSPFHFIYDMEHKKTDTASLLFGRAAHKYILEKDHFNDEFAIAPDCDRRTKAGKEEYMAFCLDNSGKDIISQSDMDTIMEMAAVIDLHPIARQLLTGLTETSFFWTDETTGEQCKCRPDCLSEYEGEKFIVDYKTTDSCEDGKFERSCRKYGYKLQSGMYTEGVFQNLFDQYRFAFVAQEKTAPYAVRVYICTPEYVNQGYDQFRELIGIYHSCKETGNWYGYEGPFNSVTELLEEGE